VKSIEFGRERPALESGEAIKVFEERVHKFVSDSLGGYKPERYAKKSKSIRDVIWGVNRFYPWEIAILDSPLLQRLRDIRQTGLAYLVYPTAVHTRFDHTLGVVAVASRIVRSINDKYPQREDPRISYAGHMQVRLSAILHDVGHCCLSHTSETIYAASEEFKALTKYVNDQFKVTPKPHEIMSWLIVRSQRFKEFIKDLMQKGLFLGWECSPDDVDIVAGNIIGFRENSKQKFLADIINGPMDADKLDYLVRDAYFAGPAVVYDLERFLQTVDAIQYPRDTSLPGEGRVVRLSIPIEGVTALEQIIVSKLMLFSYLYHHHKIRCAEAMFQEALKRLVEASSTNSKGKRFPLLDHPTSFLQLSDRSFFARAWPPEIEGDKAAGGILRMLARRELYMRALVVSRLFINDIDTNQAVKSGFETLLWRGRDLAARHKLRQEIFEKAKEKMSSGPHKERTRELRKRFEPRHIIIDMPPSPRVEEVVAVMVPLTRDLSGSSQEYVPLSEIFPIEKWVDAYDAIKWRGHIFALEEAVPFVNAATLEILAVEPYLLKFTRQATDLCKITTPISPDLRLL
jgi:HD superfamily phosphohydrolase